MDANQTNSTAPKTYEEAGGGSLSDQAYIMRHRTTLQILDLIDQAARAHQTHQHHDRTNWWYVEDLGKVNELLAQAYNLLRTDHAPDDALVAYPMIRQKWD